MLFVLIGASLLFGYLNGFKDSGAVVATTIAAGIIPPRRALLLAGLMEFAGPFLFGVAVATTIGTGLVTLPALTPLAILSALLGALLWGVITWVLGLPSSSSHTLVGGLVGAGMATGGLTAIYWDGVLKVALVLFASPLIGAVGGYFFLQFVRTLLRAATSRRRVIRSLHAGQVLTSLALALVQSTNDAQKSMGMITLSLVSTGWLATFAVPPWVVVISALAIALGTATAGLRVIRTLGRGIYKVRPIHGFCAQTCSVLVILAAALLGGPVSTTQVVSASIVGAGASERPGKVRWMVATSIVVAWLVTIPATAGLSSLTFVGLRLAGL